MNTTFILGAAITLTLGSLVPAQAQTSRQEADLQRRNMREFLRYQRHYQEELQKVQDTLLEENESLQFNYSESVISEGAYLEANSAYEKLEAVKLALLPASKVLQDAVLKIQQTLRQPGKTPQFYQAQLRNLQAAKIKLTNLRDSLKEDEEVKLAFEEVVALEKKYLAASRAYEENMAKVMDKDPRAVDIQKKLDEYAAKIRLARVQPKR